MKINRWYGFLWVIIWAAVSVAYWLNAAKLWEYRYYDLLFQTRGNIAASNDIVLVAIDDESIEWLGGWPWPRSYHAKLIEQLNRHGARLIGFDIIFDSPQELGQAQDLQLAKTLKKNPNVYLASMFGSRQVPGHGYIETYRRPIDPFAGYALGVGFANPIFDFDGRVRRGRLMTYYDQRRYPSFALGLFKNLHHINEPVVVNRNYLKIGSYQAPYDQEGSFAIDYTAPAGKAFLRIPYNQVLDGSIFKRQPQIVKNKIVLVGATAAILQDLFATPFSSQKVMPGVEVQAHQLQTLLDQKFIYQVPKIINFVLLTLGSLGFFFILIRYKALIALGVGLLGTLVSLGVAILMFKYGYWYFDGHIYGLASMPVQYSLIAAWQYFTENKEKNFIRTLFKKYLSSDVVEHVLKNPVNLAGEKREMTVLFCDLQGFTAFAETNPPEQVVNLLNRYFEKMSQIVFKYAGTVDKYMGDAVMAFWGAPLLQSEHAGLAVCAAFEMQMALEQLTQKEKLFDSFKVKIGMATGPMIVGNLGSNEHLSYTVIGDAVNIAARLQAFTLESSTDHSQILVTEETYQQVRLWVEAKNLGQHFLKGRSQKVQIYKITAVNVPAQIQSFLKTL